MVLSSYWHAHASPPLVLAAHLCRDGVISDLTQGRGLPFAARIRFNPSPANALPVTQRVYARLTEIRSANLDCDNP